MSFVNIGEDHEGNLWAASGMGLIKISETKFSAYGLTEGIHGGGSSICADDEGNVWSGLTDHIVDKYDGTRFVGQKAYQKLLIWRKTVFFHRKMVYGSVCEVKNWHIIHTEMLKYLTYQNMQPVI
ncbi:MAG: hypothetical protein H6629_21465 [Calditrichae bacterium]|nr:hypothetical protein [Calditrichia bacterium]